MARGEVWPTERGTSSGRAARIFVAYLWELSLREWVQAAQRRGVTEGMNIAETALRIALRQLSDQRDAADATAAVFDALQRFNSDEGRRLTRSRYVTRHLRPATENAVLAVVVRPHLSAKDFATLYAPFQSAIPSALLFGLAE
jgi:hypothetical protein